MQDDSARKALQTFTNGKGDVLISYENDAIFAQQHGAVDRHRHAVRDDPHREPDRRHDGEQAPHASPGVPRLPVQQAGQEIFADNGYRPVVSGVTSSKVTFATPPGLFTINDLGGWTDVTNKFFDATKGIVTKIEQSNGVSNQQVRFA